MKNPTESKKSREQSWEFPVDPVLGIFAVIDKATQKVLREYNVASLPMNIRQRLEVQGASTILQQRKAGATGEEALRRMDAHFANWQTGKFVMDRQAPLTVPAWLAGAVMNKYGIIFAVAMVSIEKKRAESEPEEWADFLESMQEYREKGETATAVDL